MKHSPSMTRQQFADKHEIELTEEFNLVLDQLAEHRQHTFLTGHAGTGKSTLIELFRETTEMDIAVLAPTGRAAINVQGQTIHSFFRFPPHFMTEETVRQIRVRKERRRIYENLDAIVIDEASMVRADMLDAINWFLQKYGPKKGLAFGGVQIILVGDLFQLPPIVGRQEQQYFHQVYKTPYFFSAKCYNAVGFQTIQLSTIFRQHDDEFITILNKIRNGDMDKETLDRLNRRVGAVVKGVNSDQPPVTLATTNKVVTEINHSQLDKIPREAYSFRATTKGNFPNSGSALPCPGQLNLKQGARVMFVKNGENWVNGSLGKVVKVDDKQIGVKLDRGGTHIVTREEWENIRYGYNPGANEVTTEVTGKLKQYPLRLAWAITIHKSQGMTFDKVRLDFSRAPFTHGQTYVAMSRCRSLEGLTLTTPIQPRDIMVDERIVDFLRSTR